MSTVIGPLPPARRSPQRVPARSAFRALSPSGSPSACRATAGGRPKARQRKKGGSARSRTPFAHHIGIAARIRPLRCPNVHETDCSAAAERAAAGLPRIRGRCVRRCRVRDDRTPGIPACPACPSSRRPVRTCCTDYSSSTCMQPFRTRCMRARPPPARMIILHCLADAARLLRAVPAHRIA